MLTRRLLLLVAALLVLTMLAVLVAPPVPPRSMTPSVPSAAPSAAPAGGSGEAITRTLTAQAGVRPVLIPAEVGDSVTLTVRGRVLDTVSVGDLANAQAVEPGVDAEFDLFVDTPGRYPIRLDDAGTLLGTLEVRTP